MEKLYWSVLNTSCNEEEPNAQPLVEELGTEQIPNNTSLDLYWQMLGMQRSFELTETKECAADSDVESKLYQPLHYAAY